MLHVNKRIYTIVDDIRDKLTQHPVIKVSPMELAKITGASKNTIQKYMDQIILRLRNRGVLVNQFSFNKANTSQNWLMIYSNPEDVITYLTSIGANNIQSSLCSQEVTL